MDKIYCGASVYDSASRTFCKRYVVTREDKIVSVTEDIRAYGTAERVDCGGLYIIPGMLDVHTHGRSGLDYTSITAQQLGELQTAYACVGTTSVMATLASSSYEEWKRVARVCAQYAAEQHMGAFLAGVHLEGRYLSEVRRGAHLTEFLVPPSTEELAEMTDILASLPVHISLAPELDGSSAFIQEAIRRGATVGIAHSDCTYEQALEAIAAGATSFTHTYNAMSPLHHRMPGCVGASLLTDAAYSELICDGFHSHPMMSELLARTKPSEKIVLITDSCRAAGMPDGEYIVSRPPQFRKIIVKDGRALTVNGVLSGSTLSLFDGMRNFMRFAHKSLEEAIPAATENPARMVGIYDRVGSIDAGKRADMLLIDNPADPRLCAVICGGIPMENR